jgi:glycerol-1-phosphate dehydrogenase [NAD(P)+]
MRKNIMDILAKIKQAAAEGEDHSLKEIDLERIVIEAGAIEQVVPYLLEKNYKKVILVADQNTYEAAGEIVASSLNNTAISSQVTLIKPDRQGDVIADEVSIIQLILEIQQFSAEIVVAIGSGTIHDITRYAAFTTGIPFISVPTAPSVDGFNSKGAPIIIRGEKKTILAIGPDAIFADLDILTKAPRAMVAAGFGDMLGKYTSLFDWKFGSLVAGEAYSQVAADITRNALMQCVDQVEQIAKRDEAGIRTLISALIESGLAMLLFGQSHPASGAEHHLSHYWEMEFIRLGNRQLLHGAKVGVACTEISALYHRIAEAGLPGELVDSSKEYTLPEDQKARLALIRSNWEEICNEIQQIPTANTLIKLIAQVSGPTSIVELGVSEELLNRSLLEAHEIRANRYTLLHARNKLT